MSYSFPNLVDVDFDSLYQELCAIVKENNNFNHVVYSIGKYFDIDPDFIPIVAVFNYIAYPTSNMSDLPHNPTKLIIKVLRTFIDAKLIKIEKASVLLL